MKINEVEKLLNIPKATIRFYEKEGLLNPERKSNAYRDYSDSDVELLKKIIVLRKIGISVEDIKQILNDQLSLQNALDKNIVALHEQMKELEGALKLCTIIQKNEDHLDSFNEEYYWNMIHSEEQKGNRFNTIVNDIIDFESKVIGDEFGLLDEFGNMRFSLGKSIIIALIMCICAGLLWYFLDGMKVNAFIEGFLFPFICIIFTSIFGLPVYFIEKKNPKLAKLLKNIGMTIGVIILVIIIILMILGV